MTTTSALTCRTVADHLPGPGNYRTAPAGARRRRWLRDELVFPPLFLKTNLGLTVIGTAG